MTATDTLKKRAECYANNDFAGVYALYSIRSEFRQFFKDVESYVIHAEQHHSKLSIFQELSILEEKNRGGLAQVHCIESFIKDGEAVCYHTSSKLCLEDGEWRILSETRTLHSPQVTM